MPLITIIIVLVVVGAALWAINTYVPMTKPVKAILNIVVAVVSRVCRRLSLPKRILLYPVRSFASRPSRS